MLPLPAIRQLGARSSILLHSYPSFYACYLLKSIQIPQTNTVYIGSTPSPPRRIRQHNGEIAAGARKTQRKRPWVMQMIVYGFPSRLAALQFEWVWQHPHKSRHMRDENGRFFGSRRFRDMKKNIAIVRSMVGRHPFNTWALHVKLFTEEAVHYWNAAESLPTVPPLPPGFTCSIELEGVDGKSGHPGSGRTGPMVADDDEFTAALLAKITALLDSGRNLECSVCHEPLHTYDSDPLSTTICPTTGCTSVAHLSCLAQKFLAEEQGKGTAIIPRGGHCDSCGEYTLWGDIVRGCYRRVPPVDPNDLPDVASDDMFVTDEDVELLEATPRKRKSRSPRASRKGKQKADESTEGESFDFDGIVSSSDESDGVTPMKRKTGRRRKSEVTLALIPAAPEKVPKARKQRTVPSSSSFVVKVNSGKPRGRPPKNKTRKQPLAVSSDGEFFDFDNISSSSEGDTPMTKRISACTKPMDASFTQIARPGFFVENVTSTLNLPAQGPAKRRPGRPRKGDSPSQINVAPTTAAVKPANSSSGGESFDFDNISSNSSCISETSPPKRRPGRPRKTASPAESPSRRPGAQGAAKRRPGGPRKGHSPSQINVAPTTAAVKPVNSSSKGDFDNISLNSSCKSEASPQKRRPGRPRKTASPVDFPLSPSRRPGVQTAAKRRPGGPRQDHSPSQINVVSTTAAVKPANSSSEGESFDFDNISSNSSCISEASPPKRRPGRPRKTASPVDSPSRRPGRPRKTVSPADSSPPKNKARGRSRKGATLLDQAVLTEDFLPSSILSDSADFSPASSRPPGRPRKTVIPGDSGKSASPMNAPFLPEYLHPFSMLSQSGPARVEGTAKMPSSNDDDAMAAEKPQARNGGEIIDIDSASDSGSEGVPPKRRPGRPRKHSALPTATHPTPMGPMVTQRSIGADTGPSARNYFHTSTPAKTLGGVPSSSGSSSEVEILSYIYSSSSKKQRGAGSLDNPAPNDATPTRAGRHPTHPIP